MKNLKFSFREKVEKASLLISEIDKTQAFITTTKESHSFSLDGNTTSLSEATLGDLGKKMLCAMKCAALGVLEAYKETLEAELSKLENDED